MVRQDKSIADLCKRFVLLRIINMRGVDLNVFEFDYDQEWAGLFLNADGVALGRFGAPSTDLADRHITMPALRHTMQSVLQAHTRSAKSKVAPRTREPVTVDRLPAAKRLRANACIHCHQVNEFRRDLLQRQSRWDKEDAWVYPLPENVGLSMHLRRGNHVKAVRAGSAAAKAGLQEGDVVLTMDQRPIHSSADVQFALHKAARQGTLAVTWQRQGVSRQGRLKLAPGWRHTDLSWRGSMRRFGPDPCVYGKDLSDEEKQRRRLAVGRLAFRQGNFVSREARQAGFQPNDIITGVDGKQLEMTARQFNLHMRLNYQAGDKVSYQVLRAGKVVNISLTLPGRKAATRK